MTPSPDRSSKFRLGHYRTSTRPQAPPRASDILPGRQIKVPSRARDRPNETPQRQDPQVLRLQPRRERGGFEGRPVGDIYRQTGACPHDANYATSDDPAGHGPGVNHVSTHTVVFRVCSPRRLASGAAGIIPPHHVQRLPHARPYSLSGSVRSGGEPPLQMHLHLALYSHP